MKFIDLTIPLGVATPPWPTYEPLQLKYFNCNGSYVGHGGVATPRGMVRSMNFMD